MNKTVKSLTVFFLLSALALSLTACGRTEEPDPHEGMVEVNIGTEMAWIPLAAGVPVSDFSQRDFSSDGNIVTYKGDDYDTMLGVDVSFYQGEIDWPAVKAAGIDFAMVRCGYRGSSQGGMFEDECFRANMEGAIDAGIKVGVYFFSQSTGAIEAAQEAEYVLELIEEYDITMPVAYDWEPLEGSRAENINVDELTGSAIVFCEIIRDAGYDACVYFYRRLAYYDYDLTRLSDYIFWVGSPGAVPDFYYAHTIWQFSFTSRIDGIPTEVDLNLHFTPREQETAAG